VIHSVHRSILASAPGLPPAHVAASGVVVIFSSIKNPISAFQLRRPENFLPVFRRPTSIRVDVVDLLVCIVEAHCALSALSVVGGS
jgi:hypothetical protein